MRDVVIVGGGITGLACALRFQLLASGRSDAPDITLLEASSRLGGKVASERVAGFVIDAGADVFLARKPEGVALCRSLGIGHRLQESGERRGAFVLRGGVLERSDAYDDAGPLVTPRGGMQELTDTAAEALRPGIARFGVRVTAVEGSAGDYVVRTDDGAALPASAVVVALPARVAARVLAGIAPRAAEALAEVTYTETTTVSVAYAASDVPHPLDGYGYWIPGAGPGEVSACTWTSSKIPGRAPEGHALLRGYVRGGGDADPVAAVLAELRRTLGIGAEPLFARAHHWPEAIPEYGSDHAGRLATIARASRESPGLVVAGSSIDGAGIPDCIRSGTAAADGLWPLVRSA
jgi:oxygen-dependent protoporphyrinogen oxidase